MADENPAVYKGRPFWSGSVNLLDGVIEEVHSIEEARAADFHHSLYFSQAQVEKMSSGECAFFWVDGGVVELAWREQPPVGIAERITRQITIAAQSAVELNMMNLR